MKFLFSSFRTTYIQGHLAIEDGLHCFFNLISRPRWR